MRYSYDFYKYLMVVNRNLTLDKFLQRAGAEQGYAKKMFTEMYNSIFSECHYVEDEYDKYYKEEYQDLPQYLRKRYQMEKEDIRSLLAEKAQNPEYTIIAYDSLTYGSDGVDSLMFEDKLAQRIKDILLLNEKV